MPQNTFDVKSALVQITAWCRQARSQYVNQSWPRSTLHGVTRPQWVKSWSRQPLNIHNASLQWQMADGFAKIGSFYSTRTLRFWRPSQTVNMSSVVIGCWRYFASLWSLQVKGMSVNRFYKLLTFVVLTQCSIILARGNRQEYLQPFTFIVTCLVFDICQGYLVKPLCCFHRRFVLHAIWRPIEGLHPSYVCGREVTRAWRDVPVASQQPEDTAASQGYHASAGMRVTEGTR